MLTIRNLEDDVKTRLRIEAASLGISMEELVRQILSARFGRTEAGGLGSQIVTLFAGLGPVPVPDRVDMPREVDLD